RTNGGKGIFKRVGQRLQRRGQQVERIQVRGQGLEVDGRPRGRGGAGQALPRGQGRRHGPLRRRGPRRQGRFGRGRAEVRLRDHGAIHPLEGDRKSTRLNSSH